MFLSGTPRWTVFVVLAASIVLFSLGLTGYNMVPSIISGKIAQQLRLVENSATLNRWANVTVPIYFSVYLFNITNPEEFINGDKPIMKQIGPYVYLQKRRKEIEQINIDTVTYGDRKTYVFLPDRSTGSPQDKLFALNVPLVAIDKLITSKVPGDLATSLLQPILEGLVEKHDERLVVHRTVDQMLFEGYDVPLLREIAKLASAFLPEAKFPASSRFGLFLNKNDTAEQKFTVGTGAGQYPFANVLGWNNATKLDFWGSQYCNQINGTDGGQFPAPVKTTEPLYVFATDLCRSIYFEYERPTEVHEVVTKRFTVPGRMFTTGDVLEENRCYCEKPDKCSETGVINISGCRRGAPIMMSAPHFYLGEKKLTDNVLGLEPDKAKHETFLDVQTMTGLVLRAAKRLQINVDLRQSDLILTLVNVTDRIMPIAWIEEQMEAQEATTDSLKERLIAPQQMGILVSSAALLIGAVGVIAALLLFVIVRSNATRTAKLHPMK